MTKRAVLKALKKRLSETGGQSVPAGDLLELIRSKRKGIRNRSKDEFWTIVHGLV